MVGMRRVGRGPQKLVKWNVKHRLHGYDSLLFRIVSLVPDQRIALDARAEKGSVP